MIIGNKFTRTQCNEIIHKLSVIIDTPDLQEDYRITPTECEALILQFEPAQIGYTTVRFHQKYLEMLLGEVSNCIEITDCNIETGDIESKDSWVGYKRSMNNCIKKLKESR